MGMNNKPPFVKSADTSLIESMINEMAIGQLLTYDEISTALGRDVRDFCKGSMYSAKRSCENSGIVLEAVADEGYRRLDDSGIVQSSMSDTRRIQRASRKGLKRLAFVEFEKLTEDEKRQHIAASAQLGVVNHFATSATRKKLSLVSSSKQLAIGETLKMFL